MHGASKSSKKHTMHAWRQQEQQETYNACMAPARAARNTLQHTGQCLFLKGSYNAECLFGVLLNTTVPSRFLRAVASLLWWQAIIAKNQTVKGAMVAKNQTVKTAKAVRKASTNKDGKPRLRKRNKSSEKGRTQNRSSAYLDSVMEPYVPCPAAAGVQQMPLHQCVWCIAFVVVFFNGASANSAEKVPVTHAPGLCGRGRK